MFRKDTPNVHNHVHADGGCMDMLGTCLSITEWQVGLLYMVTCEAVNLTLESSSGEF